MRFSVRKDNFLHIFSIFFFFIFFLTFVSSSSYEEGSLTNLNTTLNSSTFPTFYTDQNVTFSSILRNQTDNSSIFGSNCLITISGTNISNETMDNSSNPYIYVYQFEDAGSFEYDIYCNSSLVGFPELINNNDTVTVNANANLNVFDDVSHPNSPRYIKKDVQTKFYANYTDLFTNLTIQNANCNISFFDSVVDNLTYNSTSQLYEYNRSFEASGNSLAYNLTCDSVNYTSIVTFNTIDIRAILEPSGTEFIGHRYSSLLITDIDRDNNIDIFRTGRDDLSFDIIEYFNSNNSFSNNSNFNQSLIPFRSGSMATLDYDNDGNLDLITCGANSTSVLSSTADTKLYSNNMTSLNLESNNFKDFQRCSITVLDYDNDGYVDILLTGTNGTAASGLSETFLYKNNGGSSFTNFFNFSGVYYPSLLSMNLNNDSYKDLVILGRNNTATSDIQTQVWTNNNGSNFTLSNDLIGLVRSNAIVLDFNNDGLDDLVLSGSTVDSSVSDSKTFVYLNNNSILQLYQNLSGGYHGSLSFGDYDNDGDYDLFISGRDNTSATNSSLYIFNGTYFERDNLNLAPYRESSSLFFDYDGDLDLDLFVSGRNEESSTVEITLIYNNTISNLVNNTAPTSPANLTAYYNDSTGLLHISWDKSTDDLTNQNSISYNLRVGTNDNEFEILSGLGGETSNPSNGYIGNMHYKTDHVLNISDGNYLIQVQAIDAGFQKSSFTALNYTSLDCIYDNVSDWIITTDCSNIQADVIISQNRDIIIREGGTLGFINSARLIFNSTSNSTIDVENGTFELGSFASISSILGTVNFYVKQDSNLSLSNATLSNLSIFEINGSTNNFEGINLNASKFVYDRTLLGSNVSQFRNVNFYNSTLFPERSTMILLDSNFTNYDVSNGILNITKSFPITFSESNVNINYNNSQDSNLLSNISSSNTISLILIDRIISSGSNVKYSNYSFYFSKDLFFDNFSLVNISDVSSLIINLEATNQPDYNEFDNTLTTNFTQLALDRNLSNVTNAIVGVEDVGFINFTESIDFSSINITNAIEISNTSIFVNISSENSLNTNATLEFFSLSYEKTPTIFRNGIECTNCTNVNYTNGNLSFDVIGFSNYSLSENSYISWYDEELVCNVANNQTTISIQYLFSNNDSVIPSTSCFISINSIASNVLMNVSGNFLTYNSNITSSGLYDFWVLCNESTDTYEEINLSSQLYVRTDRNDARLIENSFSFPDLGLSSIVSNDDYMILTGKPEGSDDSEIYYYNLSNGSIVEEASFVSSINGVNSGSVVSFDYDNDGDNDLLLSGKVSTSASDLTLYQLSASGFSNQASIFDSYQTQGSSIDVGDINNDGWQDILFCGVSSNTSSRISKVFLNSEGSFSSEIDLSLLVSDGTCLFYDYNLDGYLDIIIGGENSSSEVINSTLFINNQNNTFSENITLFNGTQFSSFVLGDIDNDNDFDLIIDGDDSSKTLLDLFTFDLNSFLFNNSIGNNSRGSNLFTDFNLDGLIDLFSIGNNISIQPDITKNFNYYSGDRFNIENTSLQSLFDSNVHSFDYGLDGDQDIISSGIINESPENYTTKLYTNDINACIQNDGPKTPSIDNLTYDANTNTLFINWTESNSSLGGSVTYNLRIGSTSNSNAYLSGKPIVTSKPVNSGYGNMRFRTNVTMTDFDQRCYRVQVQAVDNTYKRSNWSTVEQLSFTEIASDGIDQDCDGADTGAVVSEGSGSGGGGGSTRIDSSIDTTEDTTEDSETNEEETRENTEENNENNEESSEESSETNTNSNSESSSGSGGGSNKRALDKVNELDEFLEKTSVVKIFENIIGHSRSSNKKSNGNTVVTEEIHNKFFYDLENVIVTLNIPKEVILSARAEILAETSSQFTIIQDDPIISFDIDKLEEGEKYYISYELKRNLVPSQLNDIEINFTYENIEDTVNEFTNAINETKKYIDIVQDYDTDIENNETTFTLDVDFKGESVLYNVSIYQEVPKCLIEILTTDFIDSNYEFEIVAIDPVIVWHFDELRKDEKIQFAIDSIAEDDCNDQSKSFAVAKSIFILNKELHFGPYKDEEGSFKPGIILSLLFIPLFVLLLIQFTSFTQTKDDKIRLGMYIDRALWYKKEKNMGQQEIVKNLLKDGATDKEIDTIFTKNIFKMLFIKFEIAFEEFIIFLLIFINVLDFLEVLPGDFDYIKKIISWTILSFLFYQISPTKVLFGVRKKITDVFILLAFFSLIVKNFITYAIGNIQQIDFFIDLITITVKHSEVLELFFFTLGTAMLLIITLYLIFTEEVKEPSVLSLIHVHLEKGNYIRRLVFFYLALMLFFTTIYSLTFEWLAIAVDGPLVTILVVVYLLMLIYHRKAFNFKVFLNKLNNGLNYFYKEIILLFTQRAYFALGASGLLILHILTEIGNFMLPYVTGKSDSLYFGFTQDAFGRSDLLNLIESGNAPLFSLRDFFTDVPASIFTSQIAEIVLWPQALNLFIQYVGNIIFVLLVIIFPGIIWYNMYKNKTETKKNPKKVSLGKFGMALFLFSTVIFFSNPAFDIGFTTASEYGNLLRGETLQGIELKTAPIDVNADWTPIIIGLLIALFSLVPDPTFRHMLNNLVSMFILSLFVIYISLFFWQINSYFIETIVVSLSGQVDIWSGFLLFNIVIIYIMTLTFYIGGILFLLYQLWKSDEIPFEEINKEIAIEEEESNQKL